MNRRVLFFGILLATAALILAGVGGSNANQGGNTGRYKTVEISVTQYVWELVSNKDGRVICQIIVDYPTRPTNQETLTVCAEQIFPSEPTPLPLGTPTPASQIDAGAAPEPFDLAEFFASVSWRFVTTRQHVRTVQVPVQEMVVNLIVPPDQRDEFFVSIYAYEPVLGEQITGIYGVLNGWEFSCPSSRCDVPITTDSALEFWAVSSYGDESQHVMATLRVVRTIDGERIELSSLVPIVLYQDACSAIWGLPRTQFPAWAEFPALPDDLNTMEPYQYLAGQLIAAGVVNAQNCPGGGLYASGAPNQCGLDQAASAVIDWQNQYDVVIWSTAREIGIPPRLIKVMIEQESQFWPGNGRRALYEYGLAQLSQAGADVALRWDNALYQEICNGLFFDCGLAYGRLPSWLQATMRGGLMRAIDSECPTCPYGIDLARARDTIPIFARTLRSNCYQVKYLMDLRELKADYEDMWKFTFVSYHSGFQCLSTAITYLEYNKLPATWENASRFLCSSGVSYVNDFWKSLDEFDLYRIRRADRSQLVARATFVPTPIPTVTSTPTVTPTVVRSMGRIRVLVYMDSNVNNYPEDAEKVEGVSVEARFADGTVLTAQTVRGEVIFDLSGRRVGDEVTVALPDLFRTLKVRVVRDGEIPAVFRLEEPVVPPALP